MKIPNRADIWEKIKRFVSNNLVLIAITIFAFAIRLYFFRNSGFDNNQDGYWLVKLAKGILNGNYTIGGRFWNAVEPLYPFLIRILAVVTGDYLLSGKVISLFFGTVAIPVIYLFWNKLESKEVAILTSILVSINYVAWQMSLHVFRESLFLFLCSLSFLLYLLSLDDLKWIPWLAFTLGFATLARSEGFLLALSIGISILILNRASLLSHKKAEEYLEKIHAFRKSGLIYILVSVPWYLYSYIQTKEIIPSHVLWEVQRSGSLGVSWISVVKNMSTMPLFVLSILGIVLTLKRKEEYLPFYLFVVLSSIPHMWFSGVATYPRYALPLLPLILGWTSITLVVIINKLPKEITKLKFVFLFLILLFLFTQSFRIVSETETKPEPLEVIRDAMFWFNANTEKEARIIGGDDAIYGYYTPKHDIPTGYLNMYTAIYLKLGKIDLDTYHQQPYLPVIAFMIEKDTHYLIAYDSITPWFFDPTKMLKDDFGLHQFILKNKSVILSPLKRFEKNDQIVYIYRVDWEEM